MAYVYSACYAYSAYYAYYLTPLPNTYTIDPVTAASLFSRQKKGQR